jgi:hypothetical protein
MKSMARVLTTLAVPFLLSSCAGGPKGEAPEASWKAVLRALLEAPISCSFQEAPLSEVLRHVQRITDVPILLDPDAKAGDAPVTVEALKQRASKLLERILQPLELRYELRDEAVLVTRAKGKAPPPAAPVPAGLREALEKPISVQVRDVPLADVIGLLARSADVPISLASGAEAAAWKTVTLNIREMRTECVLRWTAFFADLRVEYPDGEVRLVPR